MFQEIKKGGVTSFSAIALPSHALPHAMHEVGRYQANALFSSGLLHHDLRQPPCEWRDFFQYRHRLFGPGERFFLIVRPGDELPGGDKHVASGPPQAVLRGASYVEAICRVRPGFAHDEEPRGGLLRVPCYFRKWFARKERRLRPYAPGPGYGGGTIEGGR